MPTAAGTGAVPNEAAPAAVAGQGAAPEFSRVDAMRALLALPRNPPNKFELLYDIFARARPPVPWLGDPTSAEYREVFEGLDPRVPIVHPEMANGGDFPLNRINAYMRLRLPQGGRKRATRKRKHFRKRTSRRH
jgi:hypothetical protein